MTATIRTYDKDYDMLHFDGDHLILTYDKETDMFILSDMKNGGNVLYIKRSDVKYCILSGYDGNGEQNDTGTDA